MQTVPHHRLATLRAQLEKWHVDGVLISSAANRRWLSGFTGSNGQLLITATKAILATDFRYWQQATMQAPHFTLFKHERRPEDTADLVKSAGVAKIGLESFYVSIKAYQELQEIDGIEWVPLVETAEWLRAAKTAAELEAIRAAATIADHAMAQVNQMARPGMSERALAWELEKIMREAGASGTAFTTIVASGPNSALPHHQPGDRRLQAGDALIVDLGAELDGYKSDITRTFYLGDEPDEQFQHIYEVVLAAQTAVLQTMTPGMNSKEIYALSRNAIEEAGYGEYSSHGLGHGVGLEIHELPFLSKRHDYPVTSGMVTTIEPGIYIPGWGGVRIEDLTYVTETGLENISRCPKTPLIPIAGNG